MRRLILALPFSLLALAALPACSDAPEDPGPSDTLEDTEDSDTHDVDTSVDTSDDASTPDAGDTSDDATDDTSDDATNDGTNDAGDTADTTDIEDTAPPEDCEPVSLSGGDWFVSDSEGQYFGLSTPQYFLSVEHYLEWPEPTPLSPGLYALGPTEGQESLFACTTCALIEDWTGELYYVLAGELDIASVDADLWSIDATLRGARFIHVSYDEHDEPFITEDAPILCLAETRVQFTAECVDSFSCTEASAPTCVPDAEGLRGSCQTVSLCLEDDAREDADDGPAGATPIALGDAPIDAKICGDQGQASHLESDFYTFTLSEKADIELSLLFDPEALYLAAVLYDEGGQSLLSGRSDTSPLTIQAAKLDAGTYYLEVYSHRSNGRTARDYRLTMGTFSYECVTSFDCPSADAPACLKGPLPSDNTCGIVDFCTTDDGNEHQDDGPSGATPLTLAEPISASICGDAILPFFPDIEYDFFKLNLDEESPLEIHLEHNAHDSWLITQLYDAAGILIDPSYQYESDGRDGPPFLQRYTPLPAGLYYLAVSSQLGPYDAAAEAAGQLPPSPYTLEAFIPRL